MPVLMYVLVANYPEPVGAIFSILLSLPSLILLLSGYIGYAGVVFAVALAAAINLR